MKNVLPPSKSLPRVDSAKTSPLATTTGGTESPCSVCGGFQCLSGVPIFESLSSDEFKTVSSNIASRQYAKGDVIFAAGDPADALYILCRGKVKISKFSQDGREQILYLLLPGDFIGAFNLLKADEFDFNMIALEDTTVSALTKQAFDQVILSNPSMVLKILEKAYERIIKAELLVERLNMTSPDERVIALLSALAQDFGVTTETGLVLELSMNRDELGAYSGIARETMSRKLNLLHEQGYIQLEGQKTIHLPRKFWGKAPLVHFKGYTSE